MRLAASIRTQLSTDFMLDVRFSAAPGITMVFGESGSGKTTMLRCLAGLRRPDRGTIAIGDRVMFDADRGVDVPVRHRGVGYVFQHLALFPHMTVQQNLDYGLVHLDVATRRARTESVAASFRIAHLLTRKPGEISGGERQRTALARSLVTDPRLLLLDEPLSALDHVTQSRIIEDLRAWNAARGIPILYVTHSHREVFALGEHVIALQRGKILAEGSPQQVLEAPAHESLAQLAGFENFFDATVMSLRPDGGTMHCRLADGHAELEVPLARAEPGAEVRIAVRAGDILLSTEEPRGLSARNVLPGTIASIQREGATMILMVAAGCPFEVHLTPGACESLQLTAGRKVWLVIKTHSCRTVSHSSRRQPDQND
jgi:molybdate transport system ATP-binding protein